MMWQCKNCRYHTQRRLDLLKHYKLNHGHYSRHNPLPCLHNDCPCTFKTTVALHTHLSRYHVLESSSHQNTRELKKFKCQVCGQNDLVTEKSFLEHVHSHLKNHEMVSCYFEGCTFQSNVYGTFRCHKSRKHSSHTAKNFKPCLVTNTQHTIQTTQDIQELDMLISEDNVDGCNINETPDSESLQGQEDVVANSFASLLLKLESVLHVSVPAIDELVSELEYLLSSVSTTIAQYIPILQSLQQLLGLNEILDLAMDTSEKNQDVGYQIYRTYRDGLFFKENNFLSADTLRISIGLYIDDFEICNPLGTSKKKHKVCAVYWVLSNLDSKFRSSLTNINLALLCKSVHVKEYGYNKILEPLLKDLVTLETEGVFIVKLGTAVQGTVDCVAADNLGAHSLGGFVESFSGHHICRFCTGRRSDFQTKK